MDIFEFIVFISIFFVITHFFKYLYIDLFIDCFLSPIFRKKALFFPSQLATFLRSAYSTYVQSTISAFIIIIVFYIVFYIVYKIIVEILLKLYPIFFLFPIFEAVLDIPPFPQLIKYGVFRLLDNIINAIGMNTLLLKSFNIFFSVFIFSKENMRDMFNFLFPGLGDEVVKLMENVEYQDEYKKREEEKEKKKKNDELKKKEIPLTPTEIANKKIEEETEICITNNIIPITPDMSISEKNNIELKNSSIKIKCNADNIGKYIKANY
jgi:hypothetical protein